MHIFLDFDFQNEENRFQELINTIKQSETEEKVTIVMSSDGGDPYLATVFLDFLNSQKDRITLIASDTIASAAFYVFHNFKGERKIVDGTQGIVHHRTVMGIRITGHIKNKTNSYDVAQINKAQYFSEKSNKEYQEILTKKEFKDFKQGFDVVLPYKRMLEIFKGIETIE